MFSSHDSRYSQGLAVKGEGVFIQFPLATSRPSFWIALFVLCSVLLPASGWSACWYNTNWGFRKKVVIDHNQIDADLANFPVLISLSADAELNAKALANGDDILFTAADGLTKLNHELERYATGTLIAWVKVPLLSSTEDTEIYLYYGNGGAGPQQSVAAVWTDYEWVSHDGGRTDATGNHTVVTNTLGNTAIDKIGDNASFNNGTLRANWGTGAGFNPGSGSFTIYGWFRRDANATPNQRTLSNGANSDGTGGYDFDCGDTAITFRIGNGITRTQRSVAWTTATYYLIHGRCNRANGTIDIAKNGVFNPAVSALSGSYNNSVAFTVGAIHSGSVPFSGRTDEIRMIKSALPTAWCLAEYRNQNTGGLGTFYALGNEVPKPPPGIDHYGITASGPQIAGTGWTETLTGFDAIDCTVSSDSSTVVTLSSSGNAKFYTDGTFNTPTTTVTLINGKATLFIRNTYSESLSLTGTDGNGKTGSSSAITVNPGAIHQYILTGTGPQTTFIGFTQNLTAFDAFNNLVTTDSTTVVNLSSNGNAVFFRDGTYATTASSVTLSNGTATLFVRDNTAEFVTLRALDGNGRTGTSPNIKVTSPAFDPHASASPTAIVIGQSFSLSSGPTGGSGTYVSYQWTGPSGFASTLQSPGTIQPNQTGVYSYSVTVTDHFGDTATGTVSVTVVASGLQANPSASPTLVALGQTTVLSSQPTGGADSFVGFQWSGPEGYASSAQNPGPVVLKHPGRNTFSLTVTDALGLTATATVDVLVGERIPTALVERVQMTYKVTSGSTSPLPSDRIRIKMQGIDLAAGDRIALDFNGTPIGDLSKRDGLILDEKGRAQGQLGATTGFLFTRARAKYSHRRRKLLLSLSKGKGFQAKGSAMVQATSGISLPVLINVLVNRANVDGPLDGMYMIPTVFKVKVKLDGFGGRVEFGRKSQR